MSCLSSRPFVHVAHLTVGPTSASFPFCERMRRSRKARIDLDAELLGRVAVVLAVENTKRAAHGEGPLSVLQFCRELLMRATKRGARKLSPSMKRERGARP
jgi:hypothetical protein